MRWRDRLWVTRNVLRASTYIQQRRLRLPAQRPPRSVARACWGVFPTQHHSVRASLFRLGVQAGKRYLTQDAQQNWRRLEVEGLQAVAAQRGVFDSCETC